MTMRISKIVLSCVIAWTSVSSQAEEAPAAFEISNETFECIRDMTPVRGFYVDSLSGDLEATLAVANSEDGGTYPPGSVVQLVPGEAMVKQPPGTSPATLDWEFFELDTSAEGTEIRKRGYADVVNRFGGNCLACHAMDDGELPGTQGPPLISMKARFPDREVLRGQIYNSLDRRSGKARPK